MTMNGIDISNYQASLNAATIEADFIIVKATEGLTYVNPAGDKHYQQAKSAGKLLAVYHFFTDDNPSAQADFFVANIGGYIGEAVLVLDFEAGGLNLGANGAKIFLDRVTELTGVKPLIYMSKAVVNQMDWSAVAPNYGLWAAQYANYTPTGYLAEPWTDNAGWGVWGQPVIYQYSSTGRLTGYNGDLDMDIAYMDADGWCKYAGANTDNPVTGDGPKPAPIVVPDQILKVGDTFSFTNQIYRVDEISANRDEVISYELAGDGNANWDNNGVPASIVDEVAVGTLNSDGQDQILQVGSWFKFKQTEPWTVVKVDAPSNGVKFDVGNGETMWVDATSLVEI